MLKLKGKAPRGCVIPRSKLFFVQTKRNKTECLKTGNLFQRRLSDNSIESARIIGCMRTDNGLPHIFYQVERTTSDNRQTIQEGRFSLSVDAFFNSFSNRL